MSSGQVDPVEVRGDREQPTHFLWRDRVYAVREVLGHLPSAAGGREVWRVEASPGRCFATGVYDLSFDHVGGRWTLTSTTD